ncbi:sensor histidine kinase [Paenibacillus spongiae]|uniref:histidine kinase n=1 Tax=Paenibacillus spongiae TaxID=2909671 RepID=A0ABY5SC23_9BACL|nr:HAMP domain-containing sensor histidine kinase [Paenibacillus spongiae]UVI31487.1 HAMP domain-containing histidine kinase [Paenibacillus spongiae]
MLFVWIALWLSAGLLLVANRKSPVMRWLSLLALCGGFGALASVMEGFIVMLAEEGRITDIHERWLRAAQRGCSWMSYYGLPYSFLCFAAAYNKGAIPGAAARVLPYAALVLPVGMLALPITEEYPVHYNLLAVWAIPYTLIGGALLLRKRGMNPAERKAHLVVVAAVLPAVLIALTMNNVMPLFGIYRMWRYNVWPIAFAFAVFIVALFNFGFMGVQLLIECRQMNYSLRAITSGTAMLNHAIKNDIGKIKLFSHKIEQAAEADGMSELREDIRVIAAATSHIEAMILSVHDRTQELRLTPERLRLADLVREQAGAIEVRSGDRIRVYAEYDEHATVNADPAQTAEAVSNVLNNAVEAMPGGGEIRIHVRSGKRGSTITIRDNGCGIDKSHLRKVMEPFFTTKSGRTMNFGLGLAYCYQLMNRQGGELRIESELGKGTEVTFYFPAVKSGMQ